MKRWTLILGFLAVLEFLLLTAPSNRSEAEDAFFYAHSVEQGDLSRMFHAHHALYLPAGRLIFRIAQTLGYGGRALPVLAGWSQISGAVCVLVLVALLKRHRRNAWPFALALLGSYGFWRYAVEAEIYLPMMALSLGALWSVERSSSRAAPWIAGGLLAGALLLHLVALTALAAVAVILWIRERRRAAVGLAAGVSLLVGGVLLALDRSFGLMVYLDPGVARAGGFHVSSFAKAVLALGHVFVSGNFVFSNSAWAAWVERVFPYRMLAEELFMGRHAPFGTAWIGCLTLALVGLAAAGLGWMRVRVHGRRLSSMSREERALHCGAGIWLVLAALAALRTEPDNPEMWLMALPAVWLLIGLQWGGSGGEPSGLRWLPRVLAGALLAHNWFGGMRLIQSDTGDYLAQKAAGVVGQAGPGDVLLTADSHVFVTYLAYQTGSEVLDAKFLSSSSFLERGNRSTDRKQRIWVFEDVLSPLPPVLRRRPADVQRLFELGEILRKNLHPIGGNELGAIYEWYASGRKDGVSPDAR